MLLTRAPGQAISKLIQSVTFSTFSHAILILEPPWAIESTKYGVVKFRLDRMIFKDPANGCLLRAVASKERTINVDSLIKFAESRITAPYAKKEVLLSVFRSMPRVEHGKYFCSQLVAEAYLNSGFGMIENLPPERITPAILAKSSLFTTVVPFFSQEKTSLQTFSYSFFDAHSFLMLSST